MQLKDATVLVVDDEPQYCEIMSEWLLREGCRVLAANRGAQALELAEKNKINAVVTDIRMPVMDGAEVVRRLKAKGTYTPCAVAVTGFSDLSPREAYDLGIEAQLAKPVERKVLISAVSRTLKEREELWAEPFRTTPLSTVAVQFASLAAAIRARQIAFGRGGFCMKSENSHPEESSVAFELNFAGDGQTISGQGIVRWSDTAEKLAGIEITRVGDPGRAWVVGLAQKNPTVSFIPRSPA